MSGTKKHPQRKRDMAPLYWFAYRSWGKVSRKLGVSVSTLRNWSKTKWWEDAILEIRDKYQKKLDNQYTQILDQIAESILDRLKNGEDRVTAKGDIVKVQVGARELSSLLRDVQANRALIRGEPTQRRETVSTKQKLDTIQNFFDEKHPDVKPAKKPYSSWLYDDPDDRVEDDSTVH